jgi:hypothetical protein
MYDRGHTTHDRLHFLREAELARRWRLSPRTLQRRRKDGTGPAWLTLGGRIVYALEDIRDYERRARNGGDSEAT